MDGNLQVENAVESTTKICVHWTPTIFGKKEFMCLLSNAELKRGQIVTVHFHPKEECQICPNGHCHAPNVTLYWDEAGNLCLTFEEFPFPQACTIANFAPHPVPAH
jgi:hypothetical protein